MYEHFKEEESRNKGKMVAALCSLYFRLGKRGGQQHTPLQLTIKVSGSTYFIIDLHFMLHMHAGFAKNTVRSILKEYATLSQGEEFESPSKRCKVSV